MAAFIRNSSYRISNQISKVLLKVMLLNRLLKEQTLLPRHRLVSPLRLRRQLRSLNNNQQRHLYIHAPLDHLRSQRTVLLQVVISL